MQSPADAKEQRWQRSCDLAREVIEESRVQLMLKFRFLDLALWRMPLEPIRAQARYALSTDAESVCFSPDLVLARFQDAPVEAVRDYLHLVMHCIFRHPFDESHANGEAYSLACDVVVENAVMEMCGGRFESDDDLARRQAVSELQMHVGVLAPGRLAGLFSRVLELPQGASYLGLDAARLNELRALFERDDHAAWPALRDAEEREEPGQAEELAEQDDAAEGEAEADGARDLEADGEGESAPQPPGQQPEVDDERDGDGEDAQDSAQGGDDADPEGAEDADAKGAKDGSAQLRAARDDDAPQGEDDREAEREWEDIAKQVETDLETFSREWGDEAGGLVQSLEIANRRTCDYAEFLRRFSVATEEMKVNDDEFDYIFYTYGLSLYGNMPLVEPLEYAETTRVRSFAICIDTSESVSGELVRSFLERTFEILKQSQGFASSVDIHIIQCDAKLQADTRITDLHDIDACMERFHVRGFGGTDFRPAFDYVELLRERGELADMKGLIYFTDGLGLYPEKPPDYDVAFVFMDTGAPHLPAVPPWAMKAVIDEEGITRLEGAR